MATLASVAFALFSVVALALGYGLRGSWIGAGASILIAGIFLLGEWRRWEWTASGYLLLIQAAAALGLWLGLSGLWMLTASIAGLISWDLHSFRRRARSVPRSEAVNQLERLHLRWLLSVSGIGFGLGALALNIRFAIGLWPAALLALLVVIGLAQGVASLSRRAP